ncbi:unnamed protein product, partial [Closterium sp. NIES-54]
RTNHESLQYLRAQPHLNLRQIRWLDFLESDFHYTVTYKNGASNIADALTRPTAQIYAILLAQTSPLLTRLFTHGYQADPFFTGGKSQQFAAANGVYYVKAGIDRIWVPGFTLLRELLLQETHEGVTSGHLGVEKTRQQLQRYYYWPEMLTDGQRHVGSCPTCQLMKSSRQRPLGQLQPILPPKRAWQQVTMDFITGACPALCQRPTPALVLPCPTLCPAPPASAFPVLCQRPVPALVLPCPTRCPVPLASACPALCQRPAPALAHPALALPCAARERLPCALSATRTSTSPPLPSILRAALSCSLRNALPCPCTLATAACATAATCAATAAACAAAGACAAAAACAAVATCVATAAAAQLLLSLVLLRLLLLLPPALLHLLRCCFCSAAAAAAA